MHDSTSLDNFDFSECAVPASGIPIAALGPYGDVPAAYAVFHMEKDARSGEVVDALYVYASPEYCRECKCDAADLAGRSFRDFIDDEDGAWLSQCRQAIAHDEVLNGIAYSTLACKWISYNIAPSKVPGCCTYAFVEVDDESRGRKKMAVGGKTSRLITESLKTLDGANSYEAAMTGLLELISNVIHPARISIFERGETTTRCAFERCDETAEPLMSTLQEVPNNELAALNEALAKSPMLVIPNVDYLKAHDEALYGLVARRGVKRLIAVPFFSDGDIVGFLEADDYRLDRRTDVKRLLSSVSSFVGTRIANRRLIDSLEWSGKHDGLTRLLNRRGIDLAVSGYRADNPGGPYALALIDLDNFKKMNDMYGHATGDAALQAMSDTMRSTMPSSAVLGRNGGDEFLVALTGDDVELADDAFAALARTGVRFAYRGKRHHLTISLGYALYPEHAATQDELFTKADIALYAVKLAGKSDFKRYHPDMDSRYRTRLGFTPRDLAENIPGAMLVYKADDEGTILFASEEAINMLDCADIFGFLAHTDGSFWGIVHPDDRLRVRREIEFQVAPDDIGSKTFSNFRIVTKAGKIKNVFETGRLVDLGDVGKTFYALLVDWGEYDSQMDRSRDARSS